MKPAQSFPAFVRGGDRSLGQESILSSKHLLIERHTLIQLFLGK